MRRGKDATQEQVKPKRWRKVFAGVGFLSAMAVGAMAAILISIGYGGTMQVVSKPTIGWDTAGVGQVSTDGSGIACTPTVSNGKVNVAVTGAMPGSTCTIESIIKVPANTADLKVQDATMSNLDATLLSGKGAIDTGRTRVVCGSLLPMAPSTTYHAVALQLTVPQDATVGSKPITGDFTVVPAAQYDAALCTAAP